MVHVLCDRDVFLHRQGGMSLAMTLRFAPKVAVLRRWKAIVQEDSSDFTLRHFPATARRMLR